MFADISMISIDFPKIESVVPVLVAVDQKMVVVLVLPLRAKLFVVPKELLNSNEKGVRFDEIADGKQRISERKIRLNTR
jgi:hypothetical protein